MSKREQFIAEMTANLLLPYEANHRYEEELVGEFENQFEAEYFEQFVRLAGGETLLLDLACGDGRHTLSLSRHGKRVVALDLSPNGLGMARRQCAAQEGIVFLRASMLELPLAGNLFDGVWLSQAFEYVPPDRRERFLAGVERVLKPGGMLYMSVETWMYPDVWTSL